MSAGAISKYVIDVSWNCSGVRTRECVASRYRPAGQYSQQLRVIIAAVFCCANAAMGRADPQACLGKAADGIELQQNERVLTYRL